MLTILRPGLQSTVQDLGRPGRGAIGVPPSGAMDPLALRIANRLVGNPDGAAALEITLGGPEIRFEIDSLVAIAGSRFESSIDDRTAPHAESFAVTRGQVLKIGRSLEGARAVVAVAGGIDVPIVLGSRSTLLGVCGGIDGRPLRSGDRIPLGRAPGELRPRRLGERVLDRYEPDCLLRVVLGPQLKAFTSAGRAAFVSASYRMSPRSDRMGLRLEGPAIEHDGSADLLPEGIAPGAIQVPSDGQPILLGADRPTTGGYAKIATVVVADLWRAGQVKPGDRMRFSVVSVEYARALYRRQEELLASAIEDVA